LKIESKLYSETFVLRRKSQRQDSHRFQLFVIKLIAGALLLSDLAMNFEKNIDIQHIILQEE
jgi:hypothetical protein